MIAFSNPRLEVTIPDWPLGGSRRGPCSFKVEEKKGKYRATRTTTGKPKTTIWSGQTVIVDGSDGRTYVLQIAMPYGFVKIYQSDFMSAQPSSVHPGMDRFEELLQLIHSAFTVQPC